LAIFKALLSVIGGFALTGIFYHIGGNTYIVFYGLILYGIWNILKAIYYLATGRAPNINNRDTNDKESPINNKSNQSFSHENFYNSKPRENNDYEKNSQYNNPNNTNNHGNGWIWLIITILYNYHFSFVVIYQSNKTTYEQPFQLQSE